MTPKATSVLELPGVDATMVPAEDALIEGVPMSRYLDMPLLSTSALLTLRRHSPAHMLQELQAKPTQAPDAEDDTEAKQLGSVMHAAVLEPDTLTDQYVAKPVPDGRVHTTAKGEPSNNPANTTKYKDHVARVRAEHPDAVMVSHGLMANALALRDAVTGHKRARQLLQAPGPVEVTGIWTDPETGLRVKIRPDKLVPKIGADVNLKSTRNGRLDVFQERDFYRFGYFVGAGLYSLALAGLGFAFQRSLFLVVGTEGTPSPASVAVYEVDDGALDAGQTLARALLRTVARCVDVDHFPGYADEVQPLSLPHYAWTRVDEEVLSYE